MYYYAIQVFTSCEDKFLKLVSPIFFENSNYKLIFLRRTLTIKKSGQLTKKIFPVFPGYVFLGIHNDRENLELQRIVYRMKRIKGFVRFLYSNDYIVPLREKEKKIVLQFLSFGELIGKSHVYFDDKQKITIIRGPLKGLEGHIVKVDRRKKRAKVKLDIYENSFHVDFEFSDLTIKNKKINTCSV